MRKDLVLGQWLLDEQEVERIELGEMLCVRKRIRGIGVHLERDVAKSIAHRTNGFDIPTRHYLQLDAPVALFQVTAHGHEQVGNRAVDADRHAAIDRVPYGAQMACERNSLCPELRIEHRHL